MGEHFALKNNQIFVLAEAAGGVYNSDQLRTLCEVADSESAFLKITEDQRIGFMIDPAKLPDIQAQVRKIGLLLKSYKAPGVPSPRACLGELCTFSHQPSLGDALELTTHLLKSFPAPKRYSSIGVNGCGRACLGSSTEDVHIVAEESGYKVSVGGKVSDLPQQAQLLAENVARNDLPTVVEKILAVFYQESVEGERIYDVIERVGLTPFINALPEHITLSASELSSSAIDDHSASDEFSATDAQANSASELETFSASEPPSVDDPALDDLLESTSSEFEPLEGENGLVTPDTLLDPALIEESEPLVDIQPVSSGDFETTASANSEQEETEAVADGLLEEAEFEDGTFEDVERVRDAIRTELSMSPSEDIKEARTHTDLLDEIDQGGGADTQLEVAEFEENQADSESFSDNFSDSEFNESDLPLASSESSWENETATFDSHAAATFEHQSPPKQKRMHSKVSSTAEYKQERERNDRPERPERAERQSFETKTPVSGRLAIRFEGDLLAIELPSGMCFELPFDAVPEGSELSMILPDGELKMERDGATLAVRLGMLNMRFPIPSTTQRRVA